MDINVQRVRIAAAGTFGALVAGAQVGRAAERTDLSMQEYAASCAVCHGPTAEGDGSYSELFRTRATALTVLANSDGGAFPVARIYDMIDYLYRLRAK